MELPRDGLLKVFFVFFGIKCMWTNNAMSLLSMGISNLSLMTNDLIFGNFNSGYFSQCKLIVILNMKQRNFVEDMGSQD